MSSTDDRMRRLTKTRSTARRKKKKKKGPADVDIDLSRLEEMNETELVSVAHMMGYRMASRQLLKEDLIALILGEREEPPDPIEEIRDRIWSFVDGNQRILRSQLTCDMHCPTCPHHQVVACFAANNDKV